VASQATGAGFAAAATVAEGASAADRAASHPAMAMAASKMPP